MKKGETAHWNWGKSEAEGKIVAKHTKHLEKNIKGTEVKRNASNEEPAYEIKQAKGNSIIKSEAS